MKTKEATILKLDERGYGFAQDENGDPITVPYSLPGEKVEIQNLNNRWHLKKILESSPHRRQSPCPYYQTCGGCSLQHMSSVAYSEYKMRRLSQALERCGLKEIEIDPMVVLGPELRRRAIFHALRTTTEIMIGYYQLGSHHLVDIQQCLLLRPDINGLIDPLKQVLQNILPPKGKADIFLTSTDVGLDFLLKIKGDQRLDLAGIENLKEFARHHNLARLSFENDQEEWPIVTLRPPHIKFSSYSVEASADGFLQTSEEADQLLTSLVLKEFPKTSQKIADLFCGRGTFSLPLVEKGKVDAYEMDGKALKALTQTAKLYNLPLQAYARNLFSDPLSPNQLNIYQAVVLNPPRQGAIAQSKMLAVSEVPHIVMVSCNPETFARDISLLIKGGYHLLKIYPVDQFLWSPHMEIVAHLGR